VAPLDQPLSEGEN
jgi:hypothetical protein